MTADERELIRFMEWDEGWPMTAQEINLALEQAKAIHGEDLQG